MSMILLFFFCLDTITIVYHDMVVSDLPKIILEKGEIKIWNISCNETFSCHDFDNISDFVNIRLSTPSGNFIPILWQKVNIPVWE